MISVSAKIPCQKPCIEISLWLGKSQGKVRKGHGKVIERLWKGHGKVKERSETGLENVREGESRKKWLPCRN